MNRNILRTSFLVPALGALVLLTRLDDAAMLMAAAAPEDVLPSGVKAVWNLETAERDKTSTRERVCLNGLWRWQPAKEAADAVPEGRWGYFKTPGFWPGRANYDQEDCQTLYHHPSWKDENLGSVTAAWYQREITVPEGWTDRRITLRAEYVNSYAVVFVDGKKAGEIRFPAGEVDISASCKPGKTYVLSLLVVAMPLKAVLLSYTDTNSAREVKGTVDRRGLCGDVYLVGAPSAARPGGKQKLLIGKEKQSKGRGEARITGRPPPPAPSPERQAGRAAASGSRGKRPRPAGRKAGRPPRLGMDAKSPRK